MEAREEARPASAAPNAPPPSRAWPLVVALLGLAAIAALVLVYVIASARRIPGDLAQQGQAALREARRIAEAFRSGTITVSFRSYATEVTGTTYFQFATLKQEEAFERKDEASLLWGQLALPDVVVEARAPVEYTYYLDFGKRWDFRREDGAVYVIAPAIEFNTPAIDASAIRFDVRSGSVLRSEAAALEKLRLGLTEMSKLRARANVELVREMGRRKTQEFVSGWLRHSFEDAGRYTVRVAFADERESRAPEQTPRR
jgi:hypothetical protein